MPAASDPALPALGRALDLLRGAALAAALVLCAVAALQTLRIARLTPAGTEATALVVSRDMRLPEPGAALSESTVTLLVQTATGVSPRILPHPPASLVDLWTGAEIAVILTGEGARDIAFAPARPEATRLATLIALAAMLALAAVTGLGARIVKARR
ncbi:MAG: hypothetical protein Kow0013_18190 [Pararhodobacter sp.]